MYFSKGSLQSQLPIFLMVGKKYGCGEILLGPNYREE